MYIEPVNREEITRLINKLPTHKAAGFDEINPRALKLSAPFIAGPLTHIFNLSLSQACVPRKLKISKVIPIYKKKEKFFPGNYRPISLLSIFDKLLEKLMYKRLFSFLTTFHILYDYQFGFRNNHSTILAVTEIVDNIREELDKNNHVLGLYLDLSKAFDCVDHSILLHKMSHYGIRGLANKWFKSYLEDRYQNTYVNDTFSEPHLVKTGVPQGSVLGPILFLIYVNDIANSVNKGNVRLFADDTNLFFSSKSTQRLQTDANESLKNLHT